MRALPHLVFAVALLAASAAAAQSEPAAEPAAVPAALTPPAAMQPASGTSLAAADQPAGAYDLDPRHASVVWRVRHTGVGLYTARFDQIAGTLNFDPANPERSSVNVAVQVASVSTGIRNNAGELAFDREIANALGAEDHPQITFASRRIQRTGETTGLMEGDLSLNGVTRPVTFDVTFHGGRLVAVRQKHFMGFAGRTLIKRSDFGVTQWGPFVGDEVEILVDAEFGKS
ncbi:MAG: polyisoprenoid-binding protein [Alphaproteobacteria bacterium]|nr:polyisoprenoid-binding protein [Alphaproteobacteria bacterium]